MFINIAKEEQKKVIKKQIILHTYKLILTLCGNDYNVGTNYYDMPYYLLVKYYLDIFIDCVSLSFSLFY